MSRRLIFTPINPTTTFFTYNVVGADVGAVSQGNRAALKRRASNTAAGLPCCFNKQPEPVQEAGPSTPTGSSGQQV